MPRSTKAVSAALAIACLTSLAFPSPGQAGGRPGDFDYYVLALSWSPTYCADEGRGRNEPQCASERSYAFVLHGLWPQYAKGWPEFCRTEQKPWVARSLIRDMLDIMPSPKLVIHEFKKHGTCSGLDADGYYALARRLFQSIAIPARYLRPRASITISPQAIEADFVKTNLALDPSMIAISCGRAKRLREVRICFSKDLKPAPCGQNERQSKLCRLKRVVMPPVRGG